MISWRIGLVATTLIFTVCGCGHKHGSPQALGIDAAQVELLQEMYYVFTNLDVKVLQVTEADVDKYSNPVEVCYEYFSKLKDKHSDSDWFSREEITGYIVAARNSVSRYNEEKLKVRTLNQFDKAVEDFGSLYRAEEDTVSFDIKPFPDDVVHDFIGMLIVGILTNRDYDLVQSGLKKLASLNVLSYSVSHRVYLIQNSEEPAKELKNWPLKPCSKTMMATLNKLSGKLKKEELSDLEKTAIKINIQRMKKVVMMIYTLGYIAPSLEYKKSKAMESVFHQLANLMEKRSNSKSKSSKFVSILVSQWDSFWNKFVSELPKSITSTDQ